jgi:hypothetical protein
VTEHQDLGFALARVISSDPEQGAEDEVTEGEEHHRMILSPWPPADPWFRTPSGRCMSGIAMIVISPLQAVEGRGVIAPCPLEVPSLGVEERAMGQI